MDWERLLAEIWQHHMGKAVGVIIGLVFGVLTAALGFWKALFITICIAVGYLIGKRVDENAGFYHLLGRLFKDKQ